MFIYLAIYLFADIWNFWMQVPSRQQQLQHLANGTADNPFDLLIIGGGATGTGCAVDAATRSVSGTPEVKAPRHVGLRFNILSDAADLPGSKCRGGILCRGLQTALVEREDFASGTSSKSTKLVHGGVRYLEKAVFNLDYGQLKLVFEALHERKRLLQNAPHLSSALPIMTVRHPLAAAILAKQHMKVARRPMSLGLLFLVHEASGSCVAMKKTGATGVHFLYAADQPQAMHQLSLQIM